MDTMAISKSSLKGMGLGLAADALDGGDVGPVAGSKQDRARGNHSMKELLLCWIPRGQDDIAGSGVTIGTIVLGSLQPWEKENMEPRIPDQMLKHQSLTGNISYEGDERVAKERPGGIHKFTFFRRFTIQFQKSLL